LETLPATLDETYDRLLLGILHEHRQKAISALIWLTFSGRPLILEELAEACVIDNTQDPAFDPEERLLSSNSIVSILTSLVTLVSVEEGNRSEIRLAHFSVKEYLISDRISRGPAAAFRITERDGNDLLLQSCINYIHCCRTLDTAHNFPLWGYVLKYWPWHAVCLGDDLPLATKKRLVKFLLSQQDVSEWIDRYPACWYVGGLRPPALYMAASLKLNSLVEELLQAGVDVDESPSRSQYGNPLQAACVSGDEKFVAKLLAHGANVNLHGGKFHDALQAAASGGHEGIVRKLLDAGAKVDAGPKSNLEAVASSETRNPGVVVLLLSHGASVKRDKDVAGRILHWAATLGHDTVVQAVLLNLPDPDALDGYEWTVGRSGSGAGGDHRYHSSYSPMTTAPYEAVLHGKTEVARLFLKTWSDIDYKDDGGRTALYWATFHGNIEIMRSLLHHGANIHCRGPFGWTAKFWAEWNKNSEQVALLENACELVTGNMDTCDVCTSRGA
jgi:ankyrin repeat protein